MELKTHPKCCFFWILFSEARSSVLLIILRTAALHLSPDFRIPTLPGYAMRVGVSSARPSVIRMPCRKVVATAQNASFPRVGTVVAWSPILIHPAVPVPRIASYIARRHAMPHNISTFTTERERVHILSF